MKTILVTGGNKGIGFAICQHLLKERSDIKVLLGSRDEGRGQNAIRLLANDPEYEDAVEQNRVDLLLIDISDPNSVKDAANKIADGSLFGLVNNAGIANGSLDEVMAVNYWGTRYAVDAFLPKIERPAGRIVIVSSGVGPMYVSVMMKKKYDERITEKLSQPWRIRDINELDTMAKTIKLKDEALSSGRKGWLPYGFTKALLNCYTYLLSREHPDLLINALTPGLVKTDLAKGSNATKTPWEGAAPVLFLLFDEKVSNLPPSKQGRYYGEDCKRSPLEKYRHPTEPEYDGPDGPME